jgi:hypothetical protein
MSVRLRDRPHIICGKRLHLSSNRPIACLFDAGDRASLIIIGRVATDADVGKSCTPAILNDPVLPKALTGRLAMEWRSRPAAGGHLWGSWCQLSPTADTRLETMTFNFQIPGGQFS